MILSILSLTLLIISCIADSYSVRRGVRLSNIKEPDGFKKWIVSKMEMLPQSIECKIGLVVVSLIPLLIFKSAIVPIVIIAISCVYFYISYRNYRIYY